jgi:hypothetical protein
MVNNSFQTNLKTHKHAKAALLIDPTFSMRDPDALFPAARPEKLRET